MWVCVSNKFDVYRILKEIIESITGVSCGDPSNVDVPARQVKKKLIGRKYLLVPDDLWNEDSEDWEKVKRVLVYGGEGSKLLVTTRSQRVASSIGGKVHNLQKLTDDICWSIMHKKVSFLGAVVLTQNMTSIGRDIAKKCDGLPLGANFLGSLLHLKREESYWVSINNDKDLWVQPEVKRVISILKLSYDNLSSPLKQCFPYCCLFPKAWKIEREILIHMWMAEGFLQPNEDTEKDELGVILRCKMHDLVHDLAMTVVDRNEFGIGKEEFSQTLILRSCSKVSRFLGDIGRLRNLRHLDISKSDIKVLPDDSIIDLTLQKLDLHECREFEALPENIGMLKHLSYLDLSGSAITKVPDSIIYIGNLVTFFRNCGNLNALPKELGALTGLRCLDLSYTDIKVMPESCGRK
ncbi:putative disease resistance protein RGA3 [Papaver somniferum]|uniref:putative disease resistance protein RGA3 n=1 Tax=Papaver somniferum TaxID=3469 RepID=UPI000E6F6107|nr:putative disease resistance protein RGA3 [Papaver somniferum]